MNDVLTTPEASPASSGATSLIAASSTGLKAIPAPMPRRIMLGMTSVKHVSVHGRAREEREPDGREPKPRDERRLDAEAHDEPAESTIEKAPMMRFAGRNVRPTSSGL